MSRRHEVWSRMVALDLAQSFRVPVVIEFGHAPSSWRVNWIGGPQADEMQQAAQEALTTSLPGQGLVETISVAAGTRSPEPTVESIVTAAARTHLTGLGEADQREMREDLRARLHAAHAAGGVLGVHSMGNALFDRETSDCRPLPL